MGVADDLVVGREAFERREWAAARDRLAGHPDLCGEDLEALAVAAYLTGDDDTCIRAWQSAFRQREEAGQTALAVRDAFWVAFVLFLSGNEAVGEGWMARATRMLESEPDDVVEHGFLDIHHLFRHVYKGEFPQAFDLAVRISAAGRASGDPNLLAVGGMSEGRLLIYSGRVREGLSLLDEAMLWVVGGDVSPIIAGHVICSMIEACQEIGDFRRMTEWTAALTRWCGDQPGLVPFTGQCALHRAQILRSQGAYEQALTELGIALDRYRLTGDPASGVAVYERGEVQRIRGQYEAAAAAYEEAAAYGHEPQPGLALLWLATGRTAAAVGAVRRLLGEFADPVHRSQLLPAAVEVFLAASDQSAAGTAAEELDAIAASFDCPSLTARASCARGAVTLAAGDPNGALPSLRRGWQLWQQLGARYDAARARTLIGLAFRALGDEDSAAAELGVARRTFHDLDARADVRRTDALLTPSFPDRLTAREVEVLRLVAAGRTNPQIAAALFLSEKTVARHLSNIFGKIRVSSRTAAAAYTIEHELV
ncbi:MAG TPA: LuxR C-terminal-related transcriptional regulator [Nocardioides sp.]|uniref:LuxR C-terminal-related transcriptional regulator n=1 Tax=Nocardioides sp. TaxID=35761 RepID=UPI002F3E3BF0